jgi:hemerythrin
MGFLWRDSYSIGNAGIDSEHQHLFKLAQEFFDADDRFKRTDAALRLVNFTREHFDHEEQLMRDTAYPDISAHVHQHTHLIGKLNDVAEKVATEAIEPSDLKAFLNAWLVGHIVTFDTRLSAYLREYDASRS